MERIFAAIQGTGSGNIPGRDFGYAGLAAYDRKPHNIVLIVAKSQNDNAVIYEYVPGEAGKSAPSVISYWLSIEPRNRTEHLARGNPSLLSGLNLLEETIYGAQMNTVSDGRGGTRYFLNIAAPQLHERKMELLLEPSGAPFLGGKVADKMARALYAYVQMRRGLVAIESVGAKGVEEVRFYGTDASSDSPTFGQMLQESIRS